jgi:hypothetical protein
VNGYVVVKGFGGAVDNLRCLTAMSWADAYGARGRAIDPQGGKGGGSGRRPECVLDGSLQYERIVTVICARDFRAAIL